MYCEYYQAKIVKSKVWFITGTFKNENHWLFERAIPGEGDTLEFFISPDYEEQFVSRMAFFKKEGIVLNFEKMPNRLATQAS